VADATDMRGFFAVGVERISKPLNVGNLVRTAHSFGANYFFTIEKQYDERLVNQADTSAASGHLPIFNYANVDALTLPRGCQLVGIELVEDSIPLPSFRHPLRAAYVLGPERDSLSPELQARCDFIIQIPMKFCVNVGVAGAIVMYDRLISLGRHAPRPVRSGGPTEKLKGHTFGQPIFRTGPLKSEQEA
jgi:tRNA G18 (ribose-2'-O)-methylase SpoU